MEVKVHREITLPRKTGPRRPGSRHIVNAAPVVTAETCDRLPLAIPEVCPTCGAGIVPSQQPRWLGNMTAIVDGNHEPCAHGEKRAECPLCWPTLAPAMVFWIPVRTWTPASWLAEVKQLRGAVSWEVANVPRAYRAGKTWCLVACSQPAPHVFAYFLGGQAELVYWKSTITEKVAFRAACNNHKLLYVDEHDPEYRGFRRPRR